MWWKVKSNKVVRIYKLLTINLQKFGTNPWKLFPRIIDELNLLVVPKISLEQVLIAPAKKFKNFMAIQLFVQWLLTYFSEDQHFQPQENLLCRYARLRKETSPCNMLKKMCFSISICVTTYTWGGPLWTRLWKHKRREPRWEIFPHICNWEHLQTRMWTPDEQRQTECATYLFTCITENEIWHQGLGAMLWPRMHACMHTSTRTHNFFSKPMKNPTNMNKTRQHKHKILL